MSLFLLFPCQYIFQSYTSYAIQLQFSDKVVTRLWIYCLAQVWITCPGYLSTTPNGDISGNGEGCLQERFFHLSGVVWTQHVHGLQVGLHSQANHRLGATYVCCFYSLEGHRMFYEDILFPHPRWLRCFYFHPVWKLVVVEKKWKEIPYFPWSPFPDRLYFCCIIIYLNCLPFKIARRTKCKDT